MTYHALTLTLTLLVAGCAATELSSGSVPHSQDDPRVGMTRGEFDATYGSPEWTLAEQQGETAFYSYVPVSDNRGDRAVLGRLEVDRSRDRRTSR